MPDMVEGLVYVQEHSDCLITRAAGPGYGLHEPYQLMSRGMTFLEAKLLSNQYTVPLEVFSYMPLYKPFKHLRDVWTVG